MISEESLEADVHRFIYAERPGKVLAICFPLCTINLGYGTRRNICLQWRRGATLFFHLGERTQRYQRA